MQGEKTAIFAFRGDPVCFIHVLLNSIDIHEKGGEVKIVLEGEAAKLIVDLPKPGHPLHSLYRKVKGLGLIDGVCRACAVKMAALGAAEAEGLKIIDDMSGHAGMAPYIERGYAVIAL